MFAKWIWVQNLLTFSLSLPWAIGAIECFQCSDFPRESHSLDEDLGPCPGRNSVIYPDLYDACMIITLRNGSVVSQNAIIHPECVAYRRMTLVSGTYFQDLFGQRGLVHCCREDLCNAPMYLRHYQRSHHDANRSRRIQSHQRATTASAGRGEETSNQTINDKTISPDLEPFPLPADCICNKATSSRSMLLKSRWRGMMTLNETSLSTSSSLTLTDVLADVLNVPPMMIILQVMLMVATSCPDG